MNQVSQMIDEDQLLCVLKDIIKERSDEVFQDAQLFDSLMKDLLPEKTKEIYLLTCSVKENIPKEIQKLGSKPEIEPDFTILINRLMDKYCIQTKYAEWIVEIWNLVFKTNYEKPAKNKHNDQKETPEVIKTRQTDLNTQEIETILKEEIRSLSEKINSIESENKFTRKFLFKYSSIIIFIIIQLISVPIMYPMEYIWQTVFFNPYEFINPIKYIITFLTIVANIILLSVVISYRSKATKIE